MYSKIQEGWTSQWHRGNALRTVVGVSARVCHFVFFGVFGGGEGEEFHQWMDGEGGPFHRPSGLRKASVWLRSTQVLSTRHSTLLHSTRDPVTHTLLPSACPSLLPVS
eukprot:366080-Chlamydomonas_euryale.AAC.7